MADKTGVARLRQAIENQASVGEVSFSMPFDEASVLLRRCEDELATLLWAKDVPTPKDADGEVVPLGTEKLYTDDGEMVRVDSICHGGRLWHVKRMHSDKTYWLDSLHLHCPDSWERLEKDVSKAEDKDICGYFGFAMNMPCSAECPARDAHDSCAVTAMRDVMRRAKALAGRGAKEAGRG